MKTDYARLRVDIRGFKQGDIVFILDRRLKNTAVVSETTRGVVPSDCLEPISHAPDMPPKILELMVKIDRYSYYDHREDAVVVKMEDLVDVLQEFYKEEKRDPRKNPLFSVPKGFEHSSSRE